MLPKQMRIKVIQHSTHIAVRTSPRVTVTSLFTLTTVMAFRVEDKHVIKLSVQNKQ